MLRTPRRTGSGAALVLIALSYNHDLRMRLTIAGIYLVAVSAAFFVIIAHNTPFVGYLAIKPIPIEQAMQRMESEIAKDPAPEPVRAPSVASDTRDR
jgi:hypothetical protein